jgi:multiple sugar transport system substrate-binding protein
VKARWAAVLTALLCLATACSGKSDGAGTEKGGAAEFEFWHAMGGSLEQALERVAADFNERFPRVRVKLVNQGNYTSLHDKLVAAAKAGQSPVLAQTYSDWNDEFIRAGLIRKLTPYLSDPEIGWENDGLTDIFPVFLEENERDGDYYSLPFNKSVQVLFYNKTLLDRYGVGVPTTWEEWKEASAKLTMAKPEGKGTIVGTGFENAVYREAYYYALQAGGRFFDPESGRSTFNTPETRDGISFVQGMLRDGIARLAGEDQYMSVPFGRGDVAMYVGSSAGIAFVREAVGGKFEWSTAVVPKGNRQVAFIQGTNVSMFDTGTEEQRQGAWQFMTYLLEAENSAYWAEQTGYLPIRASALASDRYRDYAKSHPEVEAASLQLQADARLSTVPLADVMDPVLIKEMEAMLLGFKSVEAGLADADKAINAKLAALAAQENKR